MLRTNLETTGDVRIGISGWRYKPWRGLFYPSSLRQRQELAFAAEETVPGTKVTMAPKSARSIPSPASADIAAAPSGKPSSPPAPPAPSSNRQPKPNHLEIILLLSINNFVIPRGCD
jgi:hypothetical protein